MRNLHSDFQQLHNEIKEGHVQVDFIKNKIAASLKRKKFAKNKQSESFHSKYDQRNNNL
jgi:hypothetical protein